MKKGIYSQQQKISYHKDGKTSDDAIHGTKKNKK